MPCFLPVNHIPLVSIQFCLVHLHLPQAVPETWLHCFSLSVVRVTWLSFKIYVPFPNLGICETIESGK